MSNIFNYFKACGEKTFSEMPLNEIDRYVISKLVTPDFTGIIPEDSGEISIQEAVSSYFATHEGTPKSIGVVTSEKLVPVLECIHRMKRYEDIRLSHFVKKASDITIEQFSGLTVSVLPCKSEPEMRFVTYRGTDDTLTGWHENCLISVRDSIPAQEDALEYLECAADYCEGDFEVIGHSKGGNLGVYAASMAKASVQDRIKAIYDFDGPGFQEDFIKKPEYCAISGKIIKYISNKAIVGTLLHSDIQPNIIKCHAKPIFAHDGFNWETSPEGFVKAESLDPGACAFENAMGDMLREMDIYEREQVVDAFFGILEASGLKTVKDITEVRLRTALGLAMNVTMDKHVRKFVLRLLILFITEYKPNLSAALGLKPDKRI